jgi:hypothetical protein
MLWHLLCLAPHHAASCLLGAVAARGSFTAERFSPQQELRLLEGGWGCFHVSNGGLRLADFWGAMAALGGCTAWG